MTEPIAAVPLLQAFKPEVIPLDRLSPSEDLVDLLNRILVTRYEEELLEPAPAGRFEMDLSVAPEAVFELPGLEGFSLVFGGSEGALLSFGLEARADLSRFSLGGSVRLRFPREWLRPVARQDGRWVDDPLRPFTEIAVDAGVSIDQDWNVDFDAGNEFTLPPSMIADTGFVIEGTLALDLSESRSLPETLALGLGPAWKGAIFKSLTLHLPDDLDVAILPESLTLTGFHIGSGGLSGSVSGTWAPAAAGSLFGVPFGLKTLRIDLLQSALVGLEIKGALTLPFFDRAFDVELGLDLEGNFALAVDSANGLTEFTLAAGPVEILHVEVGRLAVRQLEGVLTVSVDGTITPRLGGLDWPGFEVKELSIDSQGNVHLDGGWLNLRDQYSFDFHGFQIEITRLGFGKTEDGGKWVGFSGGLKLVDGLSAGASVEGLRVLWYEDGRGPKITLNGVGVELEVPGALKLQGAVSYNELPGDIHRFDGDVRLELLALDLTIDGKLVVGTAAGSPFFAIYVGVELPAGIPLWATGLGLYGLAGLFALEMEPNKGAPPNALHPDSRTDEEWYENADGSPGWYKRPAEGVTDLRSKWDPRAGSLALGGGITIGTVVDNGFTFSGKLLLVLVFPGPILLLEGKASLLAERSSLDEEPNFRALAVLDNRAGSFLVGLDARYKFADGGEVIDIHGGAEAFFDFDDAGAWHLYLGQRDPRERRIRARMLSIFEADAYFMLEATRLATGARVGYDAHFEFGPLEVIFEAWIEGNTVVSWKPVHYHGDLWLHGKIAVSVFGFGFGLSADARLAADVFDPFHLLASVAVGVSLPWPLPDFDVEVTLEWGPEKVWPALPLPLKEIAVEHFKTTVSWPLPRKAPRLLRPDYDPDADGLRDEPDATPAAVELLPPPAEAPVVPLDCRPHITFGRAMRDAALAAVNPQPAVPEWERIGDPARNEGPVRVRYSLTELALHKHVAGAWQLVARVPAGAGEEALFGSWAPVPGMASDSVAQVKLWLWSKTPFDYTRHSGRAWDEWFTDRFAGYPCVERPPDRVVCCDFEALWPSDRLRSPWTCPDERIVFSWQAPQVQTVTPHAPPVDGLAQALCFPNVAQSPPDGVVIRNEIVIELPEPADSVRITVVDSEGVSATGFDAAGTSYGPFSGGKPDDPHVEVVGQGLVRVVLRGFSGTMCIFRVCYTVIPEPAEIAAREAMAQHLLDELARWTQEGTVLEPFTAYRLKVATLVEAEGEGELSGQSRNLPQTEYAWFRTAGPPGLTGLSVPLGHPNPAEFDSGLEDLVRYVRQTVPATVPASGEKPALPRPVYRAYDVGVEFNEDYVDLMYRIGGRDLGLYLYDSNNRPVRDAAGRLIVLANRWGVTEELTLTKSEDLWVRVINGSDCAEMDPALIPHDKTLAAAAVGQVLRPDTVYEARLVPLLLHEAFAGYTVGTVVSGPAGALGRWQVRDEGTSDGPSRWTVGEDGVPPSRFLLQTSNLWGGTDSGVDPVKPGTLLLLGDDPALPAGHPDQPGNWTDIRLSAFLRSGDDDALGLVFRYLGPGSYYRFSMDRERRYRRLVRVIAGVHTLLAEDDVAYRQNQDYLITIEAIGPSLRVYQDGALVFDVEDAALDRGRIGLYAWANTAARFSDVRVDDFRAEAPIAYGFQLTTSHFAHFAHHLHSFEDETWRAEVADPARVAATAAAAVPAANLPSDAEARAYHALADALLGPSALQPPARMEVTRLERTGEALAFLVRGPEPVDWRRTTLEVLRADRRAPRPELPRELKLTGATFGTTQPREESVSLLLREALELEGHRIEHRRLPGPLAEETGDPTLFRDGFRGTGGALFTETFGPNALDLYTIVDEAGTSGPSAWAVNGGRIVQTSNMFGGSVSASVPDKPGTLALTGSPEWGNVRIRATLRSDDDDAIGLVFRYQDADHFYRFSMDRERAYRRLVRKDGAAVTVLWEDATLYETGRSYRLTILAYGDRLVGFLDDAVLFDIEDDTVAAGRVGFYSWLNIGAVFEALAVEALEAPPVLWAPAFASLSEVEIVDEPGAVFGPSDWAVANGVLTQSSNVHVVGIAPHAPGTYALGGDPAWRDVQISVRLRSDDTDAIGVMFRYRDGDNYYRFSMDRQRSYRRLVRKVAGVVTVLWQDAVPYVVGRSYDLTLRAVGRRLEGSLDGSPLFTLEDGDLDRGRIGLYCWANTGARFERVLVTDATRRVGHWEIEDDSTVGAPSVWRLAGGALAQLSGIQGTRALAGDPEWTDVRLTVRLRADDDGAVGVLFRSTDRDNGYRLSLDAQRNERRLVKIENGVVTTLWQDLGGFPPGDSFTLTVDAVGPRLTGYLGGARLFDLADSANSLGRVGLYASSNDGVRFERVEVRRPPADAYALLADAFAAGGIGGWSFVDEGAVQGPSHWETFEGSLRQTSNLHSLPLLRDDLPKLGTQAVAGDPAWTDVLVVARLEPLDDDAIGLIFRLQNVDHCYRFSMDRERGYRRLVKRGSGNDFKLLWEDAFAFETGRVYEVAVLAVGSTLRGYFDGAPMFVVEDGDVPAGRIGLYCWGHQDARFSNVRVYPADRAFAGWLLDEPFDALVPGRWTFVDEGAILESSLWQVAGGELTQTRDVFGLELPANGPVKPGTLALAGDPAWTDYRLVVRLRSDDDDGIGAVVRCQDRNHYYRFSMDRQLGVRRLVRKVGGVVSVLWEDAFLYEVGREYVLTLDCAGSRLTGFLDGVRLFSVDDSALPAGRIGLYCYANSGARFAEVRVAPPAWSPYHVFGPEERLPAGTRLRLFAGSETDAPADEPGVLHRFVAGAGESGRLRLDPEGADLRLGAPGGEPGHARRLLPEAAYAPVAARVVRNADGTGFFLVVPAATPAGTRLDPGEYRLRWTYRRDNRAADPASQVLSEAGDRSPEQAVLDVPWETRP